MFLLRSERSRKVSITFFLFSSFIASNLPISCERAESSSSAVRHSSASFAALSAFFSLYASARRISRSISSIRCEEKVTSSCAERSFSFTEFAFSCKTLPSPVFCCMPTVYLSSLSLSSASSSSAPETTSRQRSYSFKTSEERAVRRSISEL